MSESAAIQAAIEAILSAADLAVTQELRPGQARRLFDAGDRDGLVRGNVTGDALIRGNRSLLVQGEVAGPARLFCRIEVRGDALILGAASHAYISARNIYVRGEAHDCCLMAAREILIGADLRRGRAVVGDIEARHSRIEGLRARIGQIRKEREALDRHISLEERRLDRVCRSTLIPLNFNVGRIVRQEADRIRIDLGSFYQSIGEQPDEKLELALNEFFAKGIVGLLARTNREYLSDTPARQKVFMQLLKNLKELFSLVARRDRLDRELVAGEREIDQLVDEARFQGQRIGVHGAILPGTSLEFVRPQVKDLGDRQFAFTHTSAGLQVQASPRPGQLHLVMAHSDGTSQSAGTAELQGVEFYCDQGRIAWQPLSTPPL